MSETAEASAQPGIYAMRIVRGEMTESERYAYQAGRSAGFADGGEAYKNNEGRRWAVEQILKVPQRISFDTVDELTGAADELLSWMVSGR